MMEGVIPLLLVVCAALWLFWRSAVRDAEYHKQEAERYCQSLYESWRERNRLMARLNKQNAADWQEDGLDAADWWKGN
jgi:ABC-type nickel/cobalt efflux system permease component RcnA